MTKKPNTPSSTKTDTSNSPQNMDEIDLENQESSQEANLRSAVNKVKVSVKNPQEVQSKKIVVGKSNRKKRAHITPPPRKTAHHPELEPSSDLSLNTVRVDTQASMVLKQANNNAPAERDKMEPLATSVDFSDLQGKRAKKGTNVKPLQLQFEQALIDAIKLGSKDNDVSQSLFVGEILRNNPIIQKYLK